MHFDIVRGSRHSDVLENVMRTPIYTADLCDKRGFKCIAKKLQRHWPSAVPLRLSSAQEILSRGLGYRDLHDLQQSSEKCDRQAPVPTQPEVRDGICTSIIVFCQSSNITDIDDNKISQLVMSLPLQQLCVYKSAVQGQTLKVTEEEPLESCEGKKEVQSPVPRRRSNDVNRSGILSSNHKLTSRPMKLISLDGLKSAWEVVLRRGSLRDQSLFAVLLYGIRANDVRATKAHDISSYNSHTLIRLRSRKSPERKFDVFLPPDIGASIVWYIHKARLSENDYLFPSAKNPALPMRADEMNRIIVPYLREALGNDAQMSAHNIRQSVAAIAFEDGGISLSHMRSLFSHMALRAYLAGQKKPKE
jgi:hypothetical protein